MNRLRNRLLVAVAAGVLVAPALSHDGTAPKAKPAHWTRAADKHNGSGVQLRYDVPARLAVGGAGLVRLRFSGVTADDARVEIKAPAGLAVVPAPATATLPRGQETTLEFSVTPSSGGIHYLSVFTTQGGRTSAQSVPVATGSAAQLKRNGTAQTTPSGEKIISLPSQ